MRRTYIPLFLVWVTVIGGSLMRHAYADPPIYALEHITATAISSSEIDLAWSALTEAPPITGYKIERESPVGRGFTVVSANTNSATASYADTGLSPNTTYNYRITAMNSDGEGPSSTNSPYNQTYTTTKNTTAYVPPPDVPTGLKVTPTSGSDITISWNASPGGQNVTGYKIDRSVGGGFSPFVSSTASTSYGDSNLTPGGTYGYRVYALNDAGASDPTQAIYATMPTPPSAPGNPRAVAGNGQITVSWQPSYSSFGTISSYTVTGTGNVSVSLPGNALSTTITGLANGTVYTFYVSSQNIAGSSPIAITNTAIPAPGTPQVVTPPAPPPIQTSPPSAPPAATPPPASNNFYFSFTLQKGSRGQAVTELQNRLTKEGIYSGPITGYFGALTEAAVKAYQRAHFISPIGIIGPLTRAYLNAHL